MKLFPFKICFLTKKQVVTKTTKLSQAERTALVLKYFRCTDEKVREGIKKILDDDK